MPLTVGCHMIAKISQPDAERIEIHEASSVADANRRSVITILWRRRWTVLATVLLALAGATVYLIVATRIYTSHSSVYIEQQGVRILSDAQGLMAKSDSYLYTQAEVLKSAPILNAALEQVNYRTMKTFDKVDNPVAWLQAGKALHVEVGQKDDVVTVSLDSPYKQESADFVNAVVDAYVTHQNKQKRTTAAEMMKILQNEKKVRDAELERHLQDMLNFKKANGALSFQDNDKGNIILERLATLSSNLTAAELQTLGLKNAVRQARAILRDPELIANYIETFQTKERDGSDRELEGLREKMVDAQVVIATLGEVNGPEAQRVKVLQADIQRLKQMITDKERRLAEAHLADSIQLADAAQQTQTELQNAFAEQQKKALELNTKNAEYQRLVADVDRTQKQCDLLDSRIKEVNVNSEDAGALNIQVLEVAHPEDKPSSPRKAITLAATLLLGLMLGAGLALTRDWLDQTLRSAEDVLATLSAPILGIIPHIRGRHTQASRGQIIVNETGSEVAEAYRTVRTAVYFGAPENVKTMLVTSAAPGDGKSTTASNLAIALSQSGHRTLLLDADLRKPVQHKVFGLTDKPGLSSVLDRTNKLRDVIYRSGIPRLFVLPVGTIPQNPSEILTGKQFSQVLDALATAFDRIVIDTPPVMSVADARILGAAADVSILVVRTNKSKRKFSSLALDALHSVGANVLGVIINDMPRTREGYGYHYGSYQYAGGYGARRSRLAAENVPDERQTAAPEESLELAPDALVLQHSGV